MMRRISLLGSTGSIGVNVLKVVRQFPERFSVVGLAAGRNMPLLSRQILEFSPECVSVCDKVVDKTYTIKFKAEKVGSNWDDLEGRRNGGLIGSARMMLGGPVGQALKMAVGGPVFRNMLAGGWFPGFGGGDRRHVVAEDGEYMFDKYRVKDAGLRTVRAFHAGRYDIVVAELLKRMRMNAADIVGRMTGGIINSMPTLAPIGPQYMQAGGEVAGAPGFGGETYNLTVNYTGNGSRQDADNLANVVLKKIEDMNRRRSR